MKKEEKIKKLINSKKYKKALDCCTFNLCSKNVEIYKLKIEILFILEDCKEIIKECDIAYAIHRDKEFLDMKQDAITLFELKKESIDLIQKNSVKKEVNKLFKQEKFIEVIKTCDNAYKMYKDDNFKKLKLMAVSHVIRNLKKEKKYSEALELCLKYDKYSSVIYTQKIDLYFRQEMFEEVVKESNIAYNLFKEEEFKKLKYVATSNIIKNLMKENRYEEALSLCTEENCQNHNFICMQKINIYFKYGKYEEVIKECDMAYNLFKEEDFINLKLMAISSIINKLKNEKRYEEALNLCTKENCLKDIVIERQKISILFDLKKYDEIVKECDKVIEMWDSNYYYTNNKKIYLEYFEYSKKSALNRNNGKIVDKEYYQLHLANNKEENIYLTRIYFDDIKEEEINCLKIDYWQKILLTLAFYEKKNKNYNKKGLEFIRNVLLEKKITEEQRKILDKIKERLLRISTDKYYIIDWEFYTNCLNCIINFNYFENDLKRSLD